MHRHLIAAATLTCLLSTTAIAQTAVGTGVGVSESTSAAGAVAISGQGGRGGRGGNSSLTINNPSDTTSTVNTNVSGTTTQNLNQNVSGTTTQNVNSKVSGSTRTEIVSSGTTTVKNVPSTVAPGLAAAGLETCLGSASGTVSLAGVGIGGGSTYRDEDCTARLDSRTLFAMGLKGAAVARLCQRADIWRSMPDICAQYWPAGQPYPAGIYVAAPLVAPAGTYMSTNGTVRVIDGRDGVEKDCLNYSATKQKCYHWAGEAPRRQRTAAITPQKSVTAKPVSKPSKQSPAVEAIETAAPSGPLWKRDDAPTPDNK